MILVLLQRTQRYCWTRPVRIEPEPRIKSFSECGVEGVEVDQCVRADSVVGQSATWPVQIHRYSVGGGGEGGGGDGRAVVIVPDVVTTIRAGQTPGLIVPSKHTFITVSFPSDSSASHRHIDLSTPLHLPVTATSQPLAAQQLRKALKSVWVIVIWLILLHMHHPPVVVRQCDPSVYRVCVDFEFTGIWEKNT